MPTASPAFELFRVEDRDGWQTVARESVYADPHIQIEQVQMLTPTRRSKPVRWTVAQRKAAIAVAPILADGRFVLIRQERIPVQQTLWEFPAGQIDLPLAEVTHKAILSTVINELREEAGAVLADGASLRSLGYFLPSQGFTPEHVYLFVAQPVSIIAAPAPVGGESIDAVRYVTATELRQMVASNELTTALTLALFAKLVASGLA